MLLVHLLENYWCTFSKEAYNTPHPPSCQSCTPADTSFCCADIPLPPLHPRDQSDHVATMLYIVDFLSQFSKVLAMKPISFQDFCQSLHSTAAASAPPNPAPSAASDVHPSDARNTQPRDAAGAQTSAPGLPDLAAPSAVVNGTSGLTAAVLGVANGVATNGLLASAGADLQADDGDSTVLFDVYRGLLQFLLQVCEMTALLSVCDCMLDIRVGLCLPCTAVAGW